MVKRVSNRIILTAACLAIFICPARADAHLVTTGLGPVYDGIGHFFMSPGDALAALALALLAGLRGTMAGRRALSVLPVAWLAGGVVGLTTMSSLSPPDEFAGALTLLFLGIFIAADIVLSARAVAALATVVGAAQGFFDGAGLHEAGSGRGVLQLVGVSVTLFVLVALAAATAVVAKPMWARTVVRVVGSWIGASGLLWTGWVIHGLK